MTKKRRGRPRDPELDERILDTALALLARDGYRRMSVDAVAAEAGVTKPTIYRRWPSKAELATAALTRLQQSEASVAEDASTLERLIGVLSNFRKSLLRPNGPAMIGTILAEEKHTPELVALFRQRLVGGRRRQLRAILDEARERGEIRDDADLDATVNMLVGSFYARYLARGAVPRAGPERSSRRSGGASRARMDAADRRKGDSTMLKRLLSFTLLAVAASVASGNPPPQESATATTFYVVRHAETVRPWTANPSCGEGCAAEPLALAGMERAEALRALFRGQGVAIQAVYATNTRRAWQTATPTAVSAGVDVTLYGGEPLDAWAEKVTAEHRGQSILIVGHSNTVTPIVAALGGGDHEPVEGYDAIFTVTVDADGVRAERGRYGAR